MWNKLAHRVKRNVENELDNADEQNQHNERDVCGVSATPNSSVISRVYEQHPNLSHFHSGSAIHLGSPSPPVSPSKGSKRSLFKRFLNTTNERTSAAAFFTPNTSPSKTANNTVYYTPENDSDLLSLSVANPLVLAPKQPTSTLPSDTPDGLIVHSQELVTSLREQLAIQQQLALQFEADLSARDELVAMLSSQLQNSEAGAEKYRKEVERRQSAMRMLRRKVSELEKICRALEDEVERSREESFDRSVMDEASEGALVALHGSIGQLKGELEKAREAEVKHRQECDMLNDEAGKFADEKQRLEKAERELKEIVESQVNEIKELEGKVEEASLADSQAQRTIESLEEAERELRDIVESKLDEIKELEGMVKEASLAGSQAQRTIESLEEAERELKEILESKVNEIKELEGMVEEASLAGPRAQRTIDLLQAEATEKQQVIAEERERHNLAESQWLEEKAGLMTRLDKREYGRAADEQGRNFDEIAQRENAARAEMENAMRQKAEDEAELSSIKGRVASLTGEVDRLRRQVHDLQQESADKEVKLLQLNKARAQDKEDKDGLNIALDSKQQELELLKRKMGVKGTGGSTPAPSRVALPDLTSRRQSLTFATPSAPRPRSGTATGITKPSTETPCQKSLSSSTNVRASTSTIKPSRVGMGPPPVHRGTPLSASTSSLTRSISGKPRPLLPMSHRRPASVTSSNASYVAESDKENEAPVKTPARKSSLVPA